MKNIFITASDTDAGKTWFTSALAQKLKQQGHSVAIMKPVVTGCQHLSQASPGEDLDLLQTACSKPLPLDQMAPFRYQPPMAPHIAAELAKREIHLAPIIETYRQLEQDFDIVLVEGIGGWCVPLSETLMLADMVKALKLPVVFVNAMRVGCINQGILGIDRIRADGLEVIGWVANQAVDGVDYLEEQIATIVDKTGSPCLEKIPPARTPSGVCDSLGKLDWLL